MRRLTNRYLLAAATLFVAVATASAQPERNDTIRTNSVSFYLQGGMSGFHGLRGPDGQYTASKNYLAPSMETGILMYPRPWIRFGLGLGYTYLKNVDHDILQTHSEISGVEKNGITGIMSIDGARIQNKNLTNAFYGDFTMGIDFMEIWRERRAQWFNIWLSSGVGLMHGNNRYSSSWAYDEQLISQGSAKSVVYSNSYVSSDDQRNVFNAMYVPLGLSVEFDVIPHLTLAAIGQYKFFPGQTMHSPQGVWTAGAAIRLNILSKKRKCKCDCPDVSVYQEQILALQKNSMVANAELSKVQARNRLLSEQLDQLNAQLDDTNAQLLKAKGDLDLASVAKEKAMLEKALADQAAAEKAAAEKAALEKAALLEKIAAEKAAAERQAREKALLEQAEKDRAAQKKIDDLEAEFEKKLAAMAPKNGQLLEVDVPLSHYAVQIFAFRKIPHAADDIIFHGDNPTIYNNSGLRRYVVFTGTLEGAKAKLKELKTRYHDAFIVTIGDDGVVKPYRY